MLEAVWERIPLEMMSGTLVGDHLHGADAAGV